MAPHRKKKPNQMHPTQSWTWRESCDRVGVSFRTRQRKCVAVGSVTMNAMGDPPLHCFSATILC